MTRRSVVRVACWLLLSIPFVVSSTPPAPPPGRGFVFEGTITRAGGGSLANHVVVARGWNTAQDDGDFRLGCADEDYFPNRPYSFTSSTGRFFLTFWTCATVETLAVAVLTPDTLIMGSIVPMDAMRGAYQVNQDWYEDEGDGGCDNGSGVRQPRITSYIFNTDSLTVRVP